MKVSVVVPMYNAADSIASCLQSLREQEVRPYEVIVVDNKSSDDSVNVARHAGGFFGKTKFVLTTEVKRGPAAARNRGINIAQGDVIAFTDSDCLPRRDWVKNIQKAFEVDLHLDALGGVEIAGSNDISLVGKLLSGFWIAIPEKLQKARVAKKEDLFDEKFLITFNCAYKKDLLLRIGGFDESFQPAGEDIDLCLRAVESGADVVAWDSSVAVVHRQNVNVRQMARKAFAYGDGLAHLVRRHFSNRCLIQVPRFGLKDLRLKNGTVLLCSSALKTLLVAVVLIAISVVSVIAGLFCVLGGLVFFGFHGRRLISAKGMRLTLAENVGLVFIYVVREVSEELGRLYGSLKYKVLCI